jgi:uncharacterized membrane protein
MKPSKYDPLWENPRHWKWYIFYVCESDPRVIVPKKPKWTGRTLNFAHSRAYSVLLLTVLLPAIPGVLLAWVSPVICIPMFLAIIAVGVVFYYTSDLEIKK